MSTFFGCTGDDDLCSGGSFCRSSMDPVPSFSVSSAVDMYWPPRKRSRITAPFFVERCIQPSIDILPDECLLEIFKRFGSAEQRSSSAFVSKKWLVLLSSMNAEEIMYTKAPVSNPVEQDDDLLPNGYLTRCLEGKKSTDIRLFAIAVGSNARGGLGKLSIQGSNFPRGVTDSGLSAIGHGCPSLRSLSLWNMPWITDLGISEIAKGCRMLEKLDISSCPWISNKGLISIAKNCPNLVSLTINSCTGIGDEGLQMIGTYCSKIRSLSIKDCTLVGDRGIIHILSSTTKSLQKLKLQSLNITDFSTASIGYYGKSITNLSLLSLPNVNERGFWAMGNAHGLHNLASFTASSCTGVTDSSLEAVARGAPVLRNVNLQRCRLLSDKGIESFSGNAPFLEVMQLEDCSMVSELGVAALLSKTGSKLRSLSLINCIRVKGLTHKACRPVPCNSVRSLSVRNCPGFGSSSLSSMGEMLPFLQNIELSGLPRLTDDGIIPFLEKSEGGLAKVDFNGCLNLTDDTVFTLAEHHGLTLECLNLEGCTRITDWSLKTVAKTCFLLRDLNVSKCGVTDMGVEAIAGGHQLDFQVLSLSGCSKVSNSVTRYLRKLGSTLLGLNLQHCGAVSGRGVELLGQSLFRCDILF